ncbi:hypothetical protein FRC02_005656 [Tulasnella sp. 418]|nr:hypothetical protein FRC02_005656 [Tulasnella sp. 418]
MERDTTLEIGHFEDVTEADLSEQKHGSPTLAASSSSNTSLAVPQRNPEIATIRHEEYQQHPNSWSKFRWQIREPAAEFIGTMMLILFGTGVDCQVVLSSKTSVASSPAGSYLSISFGWGIGVAVGVWVAGGISGGHLNPAVTLAQIVFRRFPLRKFPLYALAQTAGAFVGSLIVYANYWRAIDLYEGGRGIRTVPGTASLFTTFPQAYLSAAGCFWDEFLGTAILLIAVFAVTDKRNTPPSPGALPIVLMLVILGLGACFGFQTAYALNPARDLGPRLMTWIFYGREVWNFRGQYWLWTPILGPFVGALAGAGLYDLFIYTGDDSRINSSHGPIPFPKRKRQGIREVKGDEQV